MGKTSKSVATKKKAVAEKKKLAKSLFCSFCGKDQSAVKALIAGPTVFICNECVAVCNTVLDGGELPKQVPSWDLYSDERLLDLLARSSAIADSASEYFHSHVGTLRKRGVKWAVIGKALGISRQAAWERFS